MASGGIRHHGGTTNQGPFVAGSNKHQASVAGASRRPIWECQDDLCMRYICDWFPHSLRRSVKDKKDKLYLLLNIAMEICYSSTDHKSPNSLFAFVIFYVPVPKRRPRPSDFSSPGAKYAKVQAFISMSEFGFSTGSSTLDWLPIDASSNDQMETICKICLHLSWCLSCCKLLSLPADRTVVHGIFTRTLETQHLISKSAIYRDPLSAASIKHEDTCNIDCPCQALCWFVPKLWMPKI